MTIAERILTSRDFAIAFAATEKSVTATIATDDLATLKTSKYKICFAKKVGDNEYNVVWQAYDDYLANNTFSWTPLFQLFGSNTFSADITVQASTNLVTMGLGQTSTLDAAGTLSDAVDGGSDLVMTMDNQFGPIHPGVNQLSTGIDGEVVSTPIYVAENPVVIGEVALKPVEKVMIWFEQNIETSTMFSDSRSQAIEVDLTDVNTKSVHYEKGVWAVV